MQTPRLFLVEVDLEGGKELREANRIEELSSVTHLIKTNIAIVTSDTQRCPVWRQGHPRYNDRIVHQFQSSFGDATGAVSSILAEDLTLIFLSEITVQLTP